ncbi:MAG: hypothetical protein ACOVRM_12095, partial [Planctomycetaceae bacterium]
ITHCPESDHLQADGTHLFVQTGQTNRWDIQAPVTKHQLRKNTLMPSISACIVFLSPSGT